MKILVVINSLYTGGAEFSTLMLCEHLIKKGHQVKIVRLKKASPEYNISQFNLDENDTLVLKSKGFLKQRLELSQIIEDFKPQIVHSVLFSARILVRSIRFLNPSFKHIESLVNHFYDENRLKEPGVTKFKLKGYQVLDSITEVFGTDHYHSNGQSVAEHYTDKVYVPINKISNIHRGRDLAKFNVAPVDRKELGVKDDKVVLINVARHEFQKGQDVLLEAIAKLPKEIQSKIHLIIVGREGKMTPKLNELVSENKLQNLVSFLGHRNDVPSLLNMSDIFVFPSRFEGLPGALIEAQAASLPVICTDLPMMKEVAKPNVNCLTFGNNDSTELSKNIERLVLDNQLRKDFAQKSHDIFMNEFQIEKVHDRMILMYNDLLK